ncbi:MAG: ROK family protein [Candidatus Omnitrophica bacterium]|nr:ROK family protein [Candidatus Omnitrophota bacterium]
MDENCVIRMKRIISTRSLRGSCGVIEAVAESVKTVMADSGLRRSSIIGAGIGLPGPVDHKTGLVHFLPNIPGIHRVNLKRILSRKLGLSVCVDNDAKLMCLAEHHLGAARGIDFAVCLTLGTGVGGGLILNGSLFRGALNAAGEVGHIPLNEKGPRCNCGGRGCLEAYVGNSRILRDARKVYGRRITLEELSALARKRDRRAVLIWQGVGERLGIALTGLVNVLNLDAVIIGGGVAKAGSVLFEPLRRTLRARAMSVQGKHVRVLRAKLGYDAGLIGAAILVKNSNQ